MVEPQSASCQKNHSALHREGNRCAVMGLTGIEAPHYLVDFMSRIPVFTLVFGPLL